MGMPTTGKVAHNEANYVILDCMVILYTIMFWEMTNWKVERSDRQYSSYSMEPPNTIPNSLMKSSYFD